MRRRNDDGLGKSYTDKFIDRVHDVKGNGSFGNGIDDVKVTADANELERGMGFSYTDYAKMKYDYQMWQKNNEYNEQMYNQYQSPAAMMRQYQDAGLNPALMYGGVDGNGNAIGSSSAPDSSSANYDIPQTTTDKFSRIMGVISSMVGVGSQLGQTIISAKAQKANAKRQDEQTAIEDKNAETARITAVANARKSNAEAEDKENWNEYGKTIYSLQQQYAAGEITKQEYENRVRAVTANISEQTSGNTIELSNIGVSAATQELTNMEKLEKVYDAQANALNVSSQLNQLVKEDSQIDHDYKVYAKENHLPNDPYVVVTYQKLDADENSFASAAFEASRWLSKHAYMKNSSDSEDRDLYELYVRKRDELQGALDEISNAKAAIRANNESLSRGDYSSKEYKDAILRVQETALRAFESIATMSVAYGIGRSKTVQPTKTPSTIITPHNRSSEWNQTTKGLWTP